MSTQKTPKLPVALGVTLLAGSLVVFFAGQPSATHAAQNKAINDAILKIAEAIKKGDNVGAKKQAEALAKKVGDIDDFMAVLKTRKKGGLGVGKVGGAITPDGIEAMLNDLSKAAPGAAAAAKRADDLEEMSYVVAAVAEVAKWKMPNKIKPKMNWLDLAADARTGADAFAKAAKAKNPQDLQKAANQITAACNSCHTKFK